MAPNAGRVDTPRIDRDRTGPRLVLVDSIVLAESDSGYLGRVPWTFSVDSAGWIYLIDEVSQTVLRFSPSGNLGRSYGRKGGGPSEFRNLHSPTIPVDGLILQSALGGVYHILDGATGRELARVRHTGFSSTWSRDGRALFIGNFDPGADRGVLVTTLDSLPDQSADGRLQSTLAPLPGRYAEYPGLRTYNWLGLAAWGDTLVYGYAGLDEVIRLERSTGQADTAVIPARLRRGITRHRLDVFLNPRASFHAEATAQSGLFSLWRDVTGNIVIWFQDGDTTDPGGNSGDLLGTAYITVLTPDLSRACLDAELTAPGSGRTRLTFADSLLYSFDQVVHDENPATPQVTSVVRRYRVDLSGCDWVPTYDRSRR